MGYGMGEQIERGWTLWIVGNRKPWTEIRLSCRWSKTRKARRERRRAKTDPECIPQYRRYCGWEW